MLIDSQIFMSVIILFYISLSCYRGYHKGVLRMFKSAVSVIMAIFLAQPVAEYCRPVLIYPAEWFVNICEKAVMSTQNTMESMFSAKLLEPIGTTILSAVHNSLVTAVLYVMSYLLVILLVNIVSTVIGHFAQNVVIADVINRYIGALIGFIKSILFLWILYVVLAFLGKEGIVQAANLASTMSQNIIFHMINRFNILLEIISF